jgi:hypothetical protein
MPISNPLYSFAFEERLLSFDSVADQELSANDPLLKESGNGAFKYWRMHKSSGSCHIELPFVEEDQKRK